MRLNSKRQTISSLGLLFALLIICTSAQLTKAQWSPIANPTPTPGTNIYYNSGNVGIGTTNPAALFHADKAGSAGTGKVEVARFTVNDSGASRGILIYGTTTGGTPVVGFGKNTAVDYGFFAADGTTRLLTIQDGGNVGIGTTNPAATLEVLGIQRVSQARGSDSLQFYDTTGGVVRYTIREVTAGDLRFYNNTTSADAVTLDVSGNIGIGTGGTSLSEKLEVNGNIKASGTISAKYQDVAEWVPSSEQLAAATVVVLDSTKSNQVISSTQSYDTRVAGVISAQPGITLGEKSDSKVLVATTGRVKVKVDASKGPIHIGDLLVTSDVPGVAMKSEAVNLGGVQFHRPGTLIGKALEPLEKGKGEILVLLSLQ